LHSGPNSFNKQGHFTKERFAFAGKFYDRFFSIIRITLIHEKCQRLIDFDFTLKQEKN